MRYVVSFNQLGLSKYNCNNRGKEIDFIDAILLREFNKLLNAEGMKTKRFDGKLYVWVSYQKLINDLWSIGINSKGGFAKRLKNGLIKHGLIEFRVDKIDNSKTYFTLTRVGRETDTYRMTNRHPIGLRTDTLSDDEPNNTNNIYTSNKDKRERTHFELLNNKYSNEIERLKQKYNLPKEEWRLCLGGYNDKNLKKVTLNSLERFVNNWKKNLESTVKYDKYNDHVKGPQMRRML